jgi:hypothetical protein
MVNRAIGGAPHRILRRDLAAAASFDDDDDPSIVMDSLRVLGLVRRGIDRPVVGRKAYVRLWERVRALVVLTAIIVSIGMMLAVAIGLIVLAAGFLLEQTIS